ncbi:hypothetical protein [Bradyrhizobium sp. McL0616]|uniref:hypothetical protein n=1 Tax=Bradyrhizobium sp. McL0616 TaxID=3415674 RepID=UPI003CF910EC
MVRKTDSQGTRRTKLELHRRKAKPFPSFEDLAAQSRRPTTFNQLFDPQEQSTRSAERERLWAILAREALSLGDDDDQADREMRRAFEAFKLDHRNPWSWRQLVLYFAHVEFKEKRPPGAKKVWTDDRIMEIRREIIKWKLQKVAAKLIAKKLTSNKASSFYGESFEQLRIWIGKLRKGEKEVFGAVDV